MGYCGRMQEEQESLKEKTVDLIRFLDGKSFRERSKKEKSLMEKQAVTMLEYLIILNQRIEIAQTGEER